MRLLVNADDLGYTPLINRTIFELHHQGRLFSTSLLVNLPHSQDAVDRLRACPGLGVGLHLNLTKGHPLLHPKQIPSLVNTHGEFWATKIFFARAIAGRISLSEVEAELQAQIEHLLASEFLPTHLDSHSHWQLLPDMQRLVLRLAKRYQVPGVRQASIRRTLLPSTLWLTAVPRKHHMETKVDISDYLLSLHQWIKPNGMPTDLFFSARFRHLISQPNITLEMVTHPGKLDDPDFPPDSLTAHQRQLEFNFLLSERFDQWMENINAVFSSYKGL